MFVVTSIHVLTSPSGLAVGSSEIIIWLHSVSYCEISWRSRLYSFCIKHTANRMEQKGVHETTTRTHARIDVLYHLIVFFNRNHPTCLWYYSNCRGFLILAEPKPCWPENGSATLHNSPPRRWPAKTYWLWALYRQNFILFCLKSLSILFTCKRGCI